MKNKNERREFIGKAFGAVCAVGAVATLYGVKRSLDPLPQVELSGFTTVDLSPIKEGELKIVQWRRSPIFILRKTAKMGFDPKRNVSIGNKKFLVVIGICTHLGCIPNWVPAREIFLCPCHGGEFDINGINIFGPPPIPLYIPPFKIEGTKLMLGYDSPEFQKLDSV